jgi:hypothetical protein
MEFFEIEMQNDYLSANIGGGYVCTKLRTFDSGPCNGTCDVHKLNTACAVNTPNLPTQVKPTSGPSIR